MKHSSYEMHKTFYETRPGAAETMSPSSHSNVYISNLPLNVDEGMLRKLFQPYGTIECCRVQRNAQNTCGKTFGFVKFCSSEEAKLAIEAMHGASVDASVIEVKFADQDPSEKVTGGTPSDNLYVRNLPHGWTHEEIAELFSQFGTVMTCRLLHIGEGNQGAVGLVRMQTIFEASQAMMALNGRVPQGGSEMLFIRYADTPEEKERRKAKKTQIYSRFTPYQIPPSSVTNGHTIIRPSSVHAHQNPGLHSAEIGPQMGHCQVAWPMHVSDNNPVYTVDDLHSGYARPTTMFGNADQMVYQSPLTQMQSCSIYIKNLPFSTDNLFLYEKFAPFGAILSVKPMVDEATGSCKGIGFVNYADSLAAQLAVDQMNGVQVGDKILHVSIQPLKGSMR